jgi:hypothetical protein
MKLEKFQEFITEEEAILKAKADLYQNSGGN